MLGTVYSKPTAAGLTSLFSKKDNDVNNSEIVKNQVDELLSNSFLDASKEHVDCNGPIASSLTPPFVENAGADNIPEVVLKNGEEKMSDDILDAVETPKEQSSKNQFNLQADFPDSY